MKNFFFIFLFLTVVTYLFLGNYSSFVTGNLFGIFSKVFEEKIAPEDLREKFEKSIIRVLIVPGHDNVSIGGRYRDIRETDLNIELAYYLLDFFRKDKKFHTFITRDENGEYSDWFIEYFKKEESNILIFRDYLKIVTAFLRQEGKIANTEQVQHNPAADNISLKLYAVNKLANEHNIDIVLHVHFNDYPGRTRGLPGKYNGFAIYVPEKQLPNYRISLAVAGAIKARLEKYFPKSNFPGEADTIVEDQQLIAVGSNASREGTSLLIEYGYIYEPQFVHPAARSIIMKSLAEQTYLGIKDYIIE